MTRLELFSEPFARTGNIAAEGFRNLLGRPTLGLLQTVIREALQNSIDAAKAGRAPDILLRVRTLDAEQAWILRHSVLGTMPNDAGSDKALGDCLSNLAVRVLEICDFGTTGLGGPIRADAPFDADDEPDFVNFIRNVGAARDTHHGGGTYGYGKTSLYTMSSCATILVDSAARHEGAPVRRLIGCHLGAAFDADTVEGVRKRFTGRHWWGVADQFDGVDPLEGENAAILAEDLGFPIRGLSDFGTSVMILDPLLSGLSDGDVADQLIETILWNFWPRMARTTPESRRLRVALEVEGVAILIPEPELFPPLDLFAAALGDLRGKSEHVRLIRSQRPAKDLGRLAMRRGIRADRVGPACREGSDIPRQSSCIALMRPVELVVRYIEGEPFADGRFEWAGVFMCSDKDEVEGAFASAEPPAHDDWLPENLANPNAKTWVRVALRELNSTARSYALPRMSTEGSGERGPSLAMTASKLGRLLDRTSSRGPGLAPGKGSGNSRRKTTSISQPVFTRLEVRPEGGINAVFTAELHNDRTSSQLFLVAEPHLVADGGATTSEGLGDDFAATVSSMRLPETMIEGPGSRLRVTDAQGTVEIVIPMPREAAVGLRLRLEDGEDA